MYVTVSDDRVYPLKWNCIVHCNRNRLLQHTIPPDAITCYLMYIHNGDGVVYVCMYMCVGARLHVRTFALLSLPLVKSTHLIVQ